MTLYGIIGFIAWTLSIFGFGYYFGHDRKCREIKAEEVADSLLEEKGNEI